MRLRAAINTKSRVVSGLESKVMQKLIVYSCVVGGYDNFQETLLHGRVLEEPGIRYVLYTDSLTSNGPKLVQKSGSNIEWELRPLAWKTDCPVRTARYHKCLPHRVLDPHEKSLWVDGSLIFKEIRPLSDLVNPALAGDFSLATFKHPDRSCVYQEEKACLRWKKDDPNIMRRQMLFYQQEGYPASNGLVETACCARINNDLCNNFNAAWWDQIRRYSRRDQLSFNYVCWKLGMNYSYIPGERFKSPYFYHVNHKRRS